MASCLLRQVPERVVFPLTPCQVGRTRASEAERAERHARELPRRRLQRFEIVDEPLLERRARAGEPAAQLADAWREENPAFGFHGGVRLGSQKTDESEGRVFDRQSVGSSEDVVKEYSDSDRPEG